MMLFLFTISGIFADGTIYAIYGKQQTIVEETEQVAFISWKDGIEQMILKIGAKTAANEGSTYIWIFPVPADPEDVTVYHIKTLRYDVGGLELHEAIIKGVQIGTDIIFTSSQVWPIIPLIIIYKYFIEPEFSRQGAITSINDYGVTVHKIIDKYGLVSEVITAKDANGLRRYIKDKHGVELPEEIEKAFSDYIGKNFTFVITESKGLPDIGFIINYWYGPFKELEKLEYIDLPPDLKRKLEGPKAMAVMVEFPTDRPYFPLKPTSIYGDRVIPITLCIDGFWEPNIWEEIKDNIKVEYRVGGSPPYITGGGNFRGSFDKFTIVHVKAPAKYFKEDFYFKKSDTAETIYNRGIYVIALSVAIVLLIIFGLSGILTWIIFRGEGKLSAYILAGAASIFTPIASLLVLKKAGVRSNIKIILPVFKKRWQNIMFYVIGAFFTIPIIIAVSIAAIFTSALIILPYLNDFLSEIAARELLIATLIILCIILCAAGGTLFCALIGRGILNIMSKRWEKSNNIVISIQLPIPQVLTMMVLNVVLFIMLKVVLTTIIANAVLKVITLI